MFVKNRAVTHYRFFSKPISFFKIVLKFSMVIVALSMYIPAGQAVPSPPGIPVTGFGSPSNYITDTVTEYELGEAADGNKVWYYLPAKLKYGDQAPVVIYLHGFAALTPYLYRTHIEHLTRQGNIVIFPQFQKGTLAGFIGEAGLFSPVDQKIWAQRAVTSVAETLTQLGDKVAEDEIYLYGHSLGGLIALAWQAMGGVSVQSIVLSHPQVNAQEGIPDFVLTFLNIIEIPWRSYASSITSTVVILNGTEDEIAPISQSKEILSLLSSDLRKVLYIAKRDNHGSPNLAPNHGSALDGIPIIPANTMLFSVSLELNMLDWRYYFAGLDAVMAGHLEDIPFDLGTWSDGKAVIPIETVIAEEE